MQKHKMKKLIQLLAFIILPYSLIAQSVVIEWLDNDVRYFGNDTIEILSFQDAQYIDGTSIPYYYYSKHLSEEEANNYEYEANISNASSSLLTDISIIDTSSLQSNYKVISHVSSSRHDYTLEIYILPLRKKTGVISRLDSFQLNISTTPVIKNKSLSSLKSSSYFADNSVLASGTWVKVAVDETGIYKLTYDDLSSMGITPEKVSVFTSLPGKLYTMIDDYVDDLQEIAIYDNGSYILFYGQSQDVWNYNSSSKQYVHTQHPFWNTNYYFITSDAGKQKRISTASTPSGTSTKTYTTYDDYDFVEPEESNFSAISDEVAVSGDDWYSNFLYNGESYTHIFSFDNIVKESSTMKMDILARSLDYTPKITTYIDDQSQESVSFSTTSNSSGAKIAYEKTRTYTFIPTSEEISAKATFSCSSSTAFGLVDYFSVFVKRYLIFSDKYLFFRNKPTSDDIVTYEISNASSVSLLWNVSDAFNVTSINTSLSGSTLSFNTVGNECDEYVAINTSVEFSKPTVVETVSNQNIHGTDVPDMVIVTVDELKEVAEKIADIHSDLDVLILSQNEIFNEFSGGKADVTAIRWMCKMFYDRSEDDDKFKYLLLLGDGDVNNRMYEDDCSIVMTYQSDESLAQSTTYVSDDYFGLLDDSEGNSIGQYDRVDIGIGRIPINSVREGEEVVNKLKTYIANKKRATWKNSVCFVADDDSGYQENADDIAEKIRQNYQAFSVKKVYLDAFNQESEANGDYYPEAKELSDKYINEGTLIWTYVGHGSPTTLAVEKIMYLSDVNSFNNIANLPFWVTATCDYCPYDNNDEETSGERILLNPDGGGIGTFSTTRIVYSNDNYTMTNSLFNYILGHNPETNEKWTIGDAVRLAKKSIGTGVNKRKYVLIGDPALKLSYPDSRWSVETDSINYCYVDKYENPYTDTIKALSKMSVCGYIEQLDGSIDTDFNGTVYITIYDKISELTTLQNDDDASSPMTFDMWNSVIFNGKSIVTNGRFNLSLIVPKDIDYTVGNGRIEYYATSDDVEANGYYEDFNIGGFNSDYTLDTIGPEVELYMNSTTFKDGGEVNSDPMLIAILSDESGINTSDNSIGHDITIKLNNDPSTITSINSSYTTNSETYKKGTVNYQLTDLDDGEYTLTFKVWDVQNNSTTKNINFVVNKDVDPKISSIVCYPNPLSLSSDDYIYFKVNHDRPEATLKLTLEIFDCTGRVVYNESQNSYSSSDNVVFNCSPTSISLKYGLYFYRIKMDDGNRVSKGKSERLLVMP